MPQRASSDGSRRPTPPGRGSGKGEKGLTPREREIAGFVAQGLTNRQIASRLVISERTAEFHVEQILNKFGFHSRTEVAVWVAQNGLLATPETASMPESGEPTSAATPRSRHRRRLMAAAGVILVGLASVSLVVALSRPGTGSVIRTIAGTGLRTSSDDTSAPTAADLTLPLGMAVGANGDVYFVDGNRIRKLTLNGALITIAGTPDPGYSGDGGPALAARLNAPQSLTLDREESVYVADMLNDRIRKIDRRGVIWTVAGTGERGFSGDGGPAVLAQLNLPVGVTVGFARDLYIADSANHRVRRVGSDGTIATVAGTGDLGYAGDAGPATSAPVGWPTGLTFDHKGNLYIGDAFNDRVRKLDLSGTITTVAGTGSRGYSGDGARASLAQLSLATGPPRSTGDGLATDSEGNLYIADTANHRVRRVSVGGLISTLAGTGQAGYSGDDGPAEAAQLNGPLGLAVDDEGSLYIADTENSRIRKIISRSR